MNLIRTAMATNHRFDVICVGSSSKDVFFPVSDIPTLETPEDLLAKRKMLIEVGGKYKCDDRFEALGGVAANVSVGLSRLGLAVACRTETGPDDIGVFIRSELGRAMVETSLVGILPGFRSDLSAIIVLAETGERTIFHNRDANERLVLDSASIIDTEWIFVSSLNGDWRGNMRKIVEASARSGAKIAINPGQHNLRDDPDVVSEVIRKAEILILNKDEALELVIGLFPDSRNEPRIDDELYLIGRLHELGVKVIALTDGLRGAWASDGSAVYYSEPGVDPTRRVIDTTGAGDAFSSGFFGTYVADRDIERAIRCGIANGVNVTRYYGAIDGLLPSPEMAAEIAKYPVVKVA